MAIKKIPAKVGTQPYGCVDIKGKQRLKIGEWFQFRLSTAGKFEDWQVGTVTEFCGDKTKPEQVFISL